MQKRGVFIRGFELRCGAMKGRPGSRPGEKKVGRICRKRPGSTPMAHIRRALTTAILASLLVGKAGAEQPPQLLPTSDVDVIYEVTVPSQPRIRERVRYLAAELLERVDGPHKSTTVFDRRTHQMTILTSANRTFLKLDMPQQPEEPGPKATLKRGNIRRCGIALRRLVVNGRCGDAHCMHYRGRRADTFPRRRPDCFRGTFGKVWSTTG
jgi:hypothetical protein